MGAAGRELLLGSSRKRREEKGSWLRDRNAALLNHRTRKGGRWLRKQYANTSTSNRHMAQRLHLVRPTNRPFTRLSQDMQTGSILTSHSIVIPCLIVAAINAWRLWDEHWEHKSHEPIEERVEYPYMNIRTKNFFWGDGDKVRLASSDFALRMPTRRSRGGFAICCKCVSRLTLVDADPFLEPKGQHPPEGRVELPCMGCTCSAFCLYSGGPTM